MLRQHLPRLLWCQAHSILLRRRRHVPSLLPSLLRSCVFHLSRIRCSAVTPHQLAPPCGQSAAFLRGFSVSASSCAVRKPPPHKATGACQVFDHSEMLVGQMAVHEAEELARKENLKLVDLGVNVDGLRSFRLMSGRELAEESKRQRMERKSEKAKEKEFRVTSNITDHDLEIKLRQAKDVLTRGAQVKFVIKAHRRVGQADGDLLISQLLKKVTREVEGVAVVKQGVRTQGEQQLLLRPLPAVHPPPQQQ